MLQDSSPNSDGTANARTPRVASSELHESRSSSEAAPSQLSFEVALTAIWKELLGVPAAGFISIDENFFEVGGTSLLATLLLKRINAGFSRHMPIATVFEHATIRSQAASLRGDAIESAGAAEALTQNASRVEQVEGLAGYPLSSDSPAIAIIGMTGRFPGAKSVEEFWTNLRDGVESITFFDRADLEASEQAIAEKSEGYVAARPLLKDPDMFDAEFFGVYPKEAAQMDPQHRILLECAWEVLERAGYDPAHTRESVGVFAGCSMNTYFLRNLADQRSFVEEFTGGYQVSNYATMIGNDKDFLPTRISYKLNLHGPSMSVQSACSTALVAVGQACQSLLTEGCDMALAGAVSVTFPLHRGYLAQEGGLASLDGHCRPFDEKASGTVFGHGAGIVLLKRLDDAVADGDQVLAVIRGFALNNDGSDKAGYTAPSVEGQAQVIARAQKMAGVRADSITYVEAHGTGTPLGDPIEVAALTKAFRSTTDEKNFCSLGTAKGNVGHLDVAAGATGLIKTVLQIQHRTIPGLKHFSKPNPHLDLTNSPFFVDSEPRAWEAQGLLLRAGVSAFGVGGTNAHLIVEEPPALIASDSGREFQLLVWSAKTPNALNNVAAALGQHFERHLDADLADAAYTLQLGRSAHQLRRASVVGSAAEAARIVELAPGQVSGSDKPFESARLIFCFPGQGVQAINMGKRLYETEPVFRGQFNACAEKLLPLLGVDLRSVVYPEHDNADAIELLNQTLYAQPAIFAVEYALAQLWLSWGVRPAAMVGHSVGEYVAATLAGVLSLDDALRLLAVRCQLMQQLPHGSMLAVRASEEIVRKLIENTGAELDVAAVNSPKVSVVSGLDEALDEFVARLEGEKIASRRLATSHAFHSRMLDPMLEEFEAHVAQADFRAPAIPYVSSLTGKWITAEEVAQPSYWTQHLRRTVRFADAIATVSVEPETILLEVGPSETLVQMIRQTTGIGAAAPPVLASLAAAKDGIPENRAILTALGKLWTAGVEPDWRMFHAGTRRHRVLLPTYPFDRKRHWIEPAASIPLSTYVTPASERVLSAELLQSSGVSPLANPFSSAEAIPMPVSSPVPAKSTAMLNDLKALITDLSGTDLADAESEASFLELGFDSLFLTQLTQGIQSKYKVKLTFRQIMESYPTLESLAGHLETTVAPGLQPMKAAVAAASATAPAVALPAAAALAVAPAQAAFNPAVAPVHAAPMPAVSGAYEGLFASQMQALSGLIQQQLEIIRGQQGGAVQPFAPPVSSPVPVSALPAPQVLDQPTQPAQPAAAAIEAKPAKPAFVPFKPLQRGETGGLNPIQENYLSSFIKTYNEKTGGSKSFTQQHRSVFADGRVVSGFNAQLKEIVYPIVVERAKGAYLWDKDGNRYIDILNGYGAILYGHSPDFIVEALRDQLELGFPIGPQTALVGECSELIREFTGMDRVTFCNTGSEAVMGAMRLSRTVTGRNLVVLFAGDYHGSFDEVLVKSVGNQRSMPVAPGIPRESVANILVLDYGTPEALAIIRERADEIAAVLVEPVQSRHPELRPVEFLREVRAITEKSGSALIFDEVVTGFRTHIGGMQALYGIKADLATYGKVVAGGMPMGILAGTPAFMDALDGGAWKYGDDSFPQVGVTFYAGTFMRHPLAMAAVRASLLHLKESGPALQSDLAAKTASLVQDLNAMFQEFQYPSQAETFSSWFFLAVPTDPKLARMLHFHLREQGIHIQEGFPCFLTTAHTEADLQEVRRAFRIGLEKMQAGQVLPTSNLQTGEQAPAAAGVSALAETAPAEPITDPVALDFPITEQQREIFLGTQLGDEANCAFNESTSLGLKGDLNLPALEKSLTQLIKRHQALRSTVDADGETIHVAASASVDPQVGLPIDDLSALPVGERQERHKQILHDEASSPFDLASGPLSRARLIKLAEQDHVLVLTAHHIVFDGWSTNVLYSEMSELYNAAVRHQTAALPAVLNFSEYAAQQQKDLTSTDQAKVEAFWLDQFKTLPTALQIPTDRPRPALRENAGATRRFVFAPELLKAVRKAGAKQGSTLFATLLSGFSLLIHRLAQQDDVVIGIPVAGQAQLQNGGTLVGHGVNFLPIRSHLEQQQSFSNFVKQTRKTLLDAQDHQSYTYGTLLRKLKIPSDPARLQLVEVQFNVEQVGAGLKFDSLSVDVSANPKTHVNMDLFFNFIDRGNELWLDCDYNTGLFDAATIDRWFGHLSAILDALVADAEQPASAISLLTAAQLEQILVTWNNTQAAYPRETPIHRVFEDQVSLTPDAIAVVGATGTLSYFELNEKANQLAWFLKKAGITAGSSVAVSLDRSLEVIVSLLAILKAGAAYVPIDPSYPASRLSFLVQDSKAKVLLTQRSIAAELPELATTLILLDQEWPVIALEATHNLEDGSHKHSADQLAYVMYTSGSTGNPKGVLVPHRAVLRLVKNSTFASFSSDEVFLQLAPISFDAATFEIWGALLNGGKLVLGPADRVTPEEIGSLISTHGVTTVWLTAALFHLMVTEHLETLRPLRQLLAGGDVLSVAHTRRLCQELPHIHLINGYGPTENTTFTCCHSITLESLKNGSVPIGRPITNTRIYILDVNLKPVPVGVTGELYAAGDGLALGYLNSPELTVEKFLEFAVSPNKNERLYRTGDLARFRSHEADGTVEFLGRADTQVKIRGYRIELAEIENALERSPLVRSAVVAVRTDWVSAHDAPGDKRLAAYVISAAAGDPSQMTAELVPQLRKFLQEQLPDYMQPAAIMILQSLPRTINGKVDRRALPPPVPEQLIRSRTIVYPRTAMQETLASIWSKVLGIREVSIEDTIFELGGDSLLIFRIITLANQAGLKLSARHVFQYRTIAAICEQLDVDSNSSVAQRGVGAIQAIPRSLHRRPQITLK